MPTKPTKPHTIFLYYPWHHDHPSPQLTSPTTKLPYLPSGCCNVCYPSLPYSSTLQPPLLSQYIITLSLPINLHLGLPTQSSLDPSLRPLPKPHTSSLHPTNPLPTLPLTTVILSLVHYPVLRAIPPLSTMTLLHHPPFSFLPLSAPPYRSPLLQNQPSPCPFHQWSQTADDLILTQLQHPTLLSLSIISHLPPCRKQVYRVWSRKSST